MLGEISITNSYVQSRSAMTKLISFRLKPYYRSETTATTRLPPTMSEDNNHVDRQLDELLFDFCDSESLTEEGLRELIEQYGTQHNIDDYYDFFLQACRNERITEGIIRYVLERFPQAINALDAYGVTPLHYACGNKNVTLNIIQFLIDAAPESVHSMTDTGWTPLHYLCDNETLDDDAAIQILKLLIEKYPEAVRHANSNGYLPIHLASENATFSFVQLLVDAAPDSVHSVNKRGYYPVHSAIDGIFYGDNPITAAETVKLLLAFDPRVKLQKIQGRSLLYYACGGGYDDSDINDSRIETALQIIKTIYDALPEAIEENRIASDTQNFHQRIQAFINGELVYCRQAKDHRLITTPDDSGRLPLYRALQHNARLGSIKLLVKGNPHAVRSFDNNGVIPLHVACQYHNSACVAGYLIELADVTLDKNDRQGNTALHYACRGAKYHTIALLLDRHDAVSVSRRNAQNKLPIELLWESDAVEDRESVDYTDSIFRLLKAFPETLSGVGADVQPVLAAHLGESGIGKKRKFSHE